MAARCPGTYHLWEKVVSHRSHHSHDFFGSPDVAKDQPNATRASNPEDIMTVDLGKSSNCTVLIKTIHQFAEQFSPEFRATTHTSHLKVASVYLSGAQRKIVTTIQTKV